MAAISNLLISSQDGRILPGTDAPSFSLSAAGGHKRERRPTVRSRGRLDVLDMKKLQAPALPVKAIGASAVGDDEVPDVPSPTVNEASFLAEMAEVFGDGVELVSGHVDAARSALRRSRSSSSQGATNWSAEASSEATAACDVHAALPREEMGRVERAVADGLRDDAQEILAVVRGQR